MGWWTTTDNAQLEQVIWTAELGGTAAREWLEQRRLLCDGSLASPEMSLILLMMVPMPLLPSMTAVAAMMAAQARAWALVGAAWLRFQISLPRP